MQAASILGLRVSDFPRSNKIRRANYLAPFLAQIRRFFVVKAEWIISLDCYGALAAAKKTGN